MSNGGREGEREGRRNGETGGEGRRNGETGGEGGREKQRLCAHHQLQSYMRVHTFGIIIQMKGSRVAHLRTDPSVHNTNKLNTAWWS